MSQLPPNGVFRTNRVIDDDSSGESVSDHEDRLQIEEVHGDYSDGEKKQSQNDPKRHPLLLTPETPEQRLCRFKMEPQEVHDEGNKVLVGSVVVMNDIMLLVQHVGTILDTHNVLMAKMGSTFEIIGVVEDVIGSIEAPLYYIRADWYAQNRLRPHLTPRMPVYVIGARAKYITPADIERMVSEKGTDSVYGDGNDKSDDSFDEDCDPFKGQKRPQLEPEEEGELEYVCDVEGVNYRLPSLLSRKRVKKGQNFPKHS
jgi:rRNA processing protein Gar1